MKENQIQKVKFRDRDTDTILYTIMCVVTVPVLLFGMWYLWFSKHMLPQNAGSCVIYEMFGLYCPGCGGTRSFRALFGGDILTAVYYNPGAVYGMGLYLFYFISQTIMRISKGKLWGLKFRPLFLYIMLAIIMLNFIVRNVLLFFFDLPTL